MPNRFIAILFIQPHCVPVPFHTHSCMHRWQIGCVATLCREMFGGYTEPARRPFNRKHGKFMAFRQCHICTNYNLKENYNFILIRLWFLCHCTIFDFHFVVRYVVFRLRLDSRIAHRRSEKTKNNYSVSRWLNSGRSFDTKWNEEFP